MNELLMVIIGLVTIYILYIDFKNDRRDKLNSQHNIDICELLYEIINNEHDDIESQNKINVEFTKVLTMMQGTKVPDVDKINETLKESDEKGVEK